MPDWLDLGLVAVITVFAVSGYRQGFTAGVMSLTGFACGAAVGARAGSSLCRALLPAGPGRDFLAIVIGFAAAVTGMLLADRLAAVVRLLSRRPAGLADAVGGAALNVLFLLVVAVMVSSLAAGGTSGPFSRQVDSSLVLRAVGRVAPKSLVNSMRVSMVRQLDDTSGLDPMALPLPSHRVPNSPAVALARRAVVRIETVARSCPPSRSQNVDGSGLVIRPDHVLTNAHVVAGLTRSPVVTTADGKAYQARVVLYDRRRDIAVLYVPGLRGYALPFSRFASYGASAIVAGFPGGGGLTLSPATVGSSINADITGTNARPEQTMQVYPVRGQVEPGNSGGPLMAPDGRVYGIIFARSAAPQSGWAMTVSDVVSDAVAGAMLTTSVPTPARLGC